MKHIWRLNKKHTSYRSLSTYKLVFRQNRCIPGVDACCPIRIRIRVSLAEYSTYWTTPSLDTTPVNSATHFSTIPIVLVGWWFRLLVTAPNLSSKGMYRYEPKSQLIFHSSCVVISKLIYIAPLTSFHRDNTSNYFRQLLYTFTL